MNKKGKILLIFIITLLLIQVLSFNTSNVKAESLNNSSSETNLEDSKWYGYVSYKVIDGSVTITGHDLRVKEINVPSEIDGYKVTSIGSGAFGLSSITKISLPDTITTIEKGAFSLCDDLESINMPQSLISIGDSAFFNCRSLTYINIPDLVNSIGSSAFEGCNKLNNVKLPSNIKELKDTTFDSCSSLTNVVLPDSLISIGENCFQNCCSLEKLNITSNVSSVGKNFIIGCNELSQLTVNEDNQYLTAKDEVLYNKDMTILLSCSPNKSDTFIIPDSVETISTDAFNECNNITNIVLPKKLTTIMDNAFFFYGSTSITIPGSVTNFGNGAFQGCQSIENVTIEYGVKSLPSSLITIGDYAFSRCFDLSKVTIP